MMMDYLVNDMQDAIETIKVRHLQRFAARHHMRRLMWLWLMLHR